MNTENTHAPPETSRARLARRAVVLQIKLVADGIRDAVLIPVSFVAAVIGLIRGGDDAEREFNEIIRLGRRSERWIDLFGHHRPLDRAHPAGSMDTLINRVETVLREQVRKGAVSDEARTAVEQALEEAQRDQDRE